MRFVALSALLILSAPALAASQDAPAPQPSESKPAKEKKICKLDEAGSTSRMRKRVCRTATEWEEAKSQGSSGEDLRGISKR